MKAAIAIVVIYMIGLILCYGPATVESERKEREEYAECRNDFNAGKRQWGCPVYNDYGFMGLVKTFGWPLWLSYHIADTHTKEGRG